MISRGPSNTYRLPRINNAPEIVVVNVGREVEADCALASAVV